MVWVADGLQTVGGLHGLILAWDVDGEVLRAHYSYAVDISHFVSAGDLVRLRARFHADSATDALLELSAFTGIEATLNDEIVAPLIGSVTPYGNSRRVLLRAGENTLVLSVDPLRASPRVAARLCAPDRSPLDGVSTLRPALDATVEPLRDGLPDTQALSTWHLYNDLTNRPRRMRLPELSTEAWERWRARFAERLGELLGPTEPLPAAVTVLSEEDLGPMVRQRLWFDAGPYRAFPAWALLPRERNGAAVLALHGHSYRFGETIGLDGGDPAQAEVIRHANYTYGLQLAERGYVVIAPELRGFGARRDDERFRRDPCDTNYLRLLEFGVNLVALQAQDLRTAVSYAVSEHGVAGRLGVLGLSYGGRMTMYLAALDERVACAVASGCLDTFRERLTIDRCCGAQLVPGLLPDADTPELFGLIAPRPLLIELGTNDDTSPEIYATEIYSEIERIYEAAGARDRLDIDVFESGHRFSGRKAFDWLDKWLLGE